MLAIVIPTILATLGVAFWFRASNTRARYLPDFEYSGRLELLVWSIPAMTVLLVGGVAWIGAHDLDPRKPIASSAKPLTIQVVSLDWKWLFIYPDQGIASVNHLTIPAGTPISFDLTSVGRHEQLLRAAAGQPDLHHGRNGHASSSAGRPAGNLSADCRRSSAANGFADMQFDRRRRAAREVCGVGRRRRAAPAQCSIAKTYADLVEAE